MLLSCEGATPTSREQHAEQRSPDRRLAAPTVAALQIVAVEILLVESQPMSRRQEHKEQLLQPESRLGREDRGDDFYSGAGQGQNRLQVFPGPSRSIGPNLLYPGQGLVQRALVLAAEDPDGVRRDYLGILQPFDGLAGSGVLVREKK